MNYWKCECGWKGRDDELLTAPSPFDHEDTLFACPNCKRVDEISNCCDEQDCMLEATSGWPTESGYRRTCFAHHQSKPHDAVGGRE